MLVTNASIRNANEILKPQKKTIVLNPTFSANFTPKVRTEFVMSFKNGNTIDINVRVTVESYYFM